jgi:RND family efflux transporter MFP subunit
MKNLIVLLILISSLGSFSLLATPPAELDCLVKPEMYVELSSPVDTTMKEMLVQPGDFVEIGQPLVLLESSVERAKVKLARQKVASVSEIGRLKVQLKYARLNNERISELAAKKSVSQFEKDKSDTDVELAEFELAKAKDKRKIARLDLELALIQLELKTIKSPINGVVIDRYATVGESVADRPIMKLAQIDPLRVELIAPTEYFGLIQSGMEVEIQPERPVDRTYKATVTVVDQLIDPASGSFTVRMALPNPGDQLVGGVNCMASFDFSSPEPSTQEVYSSLLSSTIE